MNEWHLQNEISKKFRNENLIIEGISYNLVCWELMFPSWLINDKKRKWNETSIDFIFFNESLNKYLCLELKYNIKTRKDLLSAYCQTTDRTIKFINQFSVDKIENARFDCFRFSDEKRGVEQINKPILFQVNPTAERLLVAQSFPNDYLILISHWNQLSKRELEHLINKYAPNNEFNRFKLIEEFQFEDVRTCELKVKTIKNLLP